MREAVVLGWCESPGAPRYPNGEQGRLPTEDTDEEQ